MKQVHNMTLKMFHAKQFLRTFIQRALTRTGYVSEGRKVLTDLHSLLSLVKLPLALLCYSQLRTTFPHAETAAGHPASASWPHELAKQQEMHPNIPREHQGAHYPHGVAPACCGTPRGEKQRIEGGSWGTDGFPVLML